MRADEAKLVLEHLDALWPAHDWSAETKQAVLRQVAPMRITLEQARAVLDDLRCSKRLRSPVPADLIERLRACQTQASHGPGSDADQAVAFVRRAGSLLLRRVCRVLAERDSAFGHWEPCHVQQHPTMPAVVSAVHEVIRGLPDGDERQDLLDADEPPEYLLGLAAEYRADPAAFRASREGWRPGMIERLLEEFRRYGLVDVADPDAWAAGAGTA